MLFLQSTPYKKQPYILTSIHTILFLPTTVLIDHLSCILSKSERMWQGLMGVIVSKRDVSQGWGGEYYQNLPTYYHLF